MAEETKIEELNKLIAIGKRKGFLTYDEVNDALPQAIVSLDQLDDIMMMFGRDGHRGGGLRQGRSAPVGDRAAARARGRGAPGRGHRPHARARRPHRGSGAAVPPRDGPGGAADPRGRDHAGQAHRRGQGRGHPRDAPNQSRPREDPRPARRAPSVHHQFAADKAPWMEAGTRFPGGTISGIRSKLGYLQDLGSTALWIGPVWKQCPSLQTYHGYGIQNFLEVDPRFGSRQDLRDLVDAAHGRGMSVLLDVIYNHAGDVFFYDFPTARYLPPLYYYVARAQEALGRAEAKANYQRFLALRGEADPRDPLAADAKKRLGS